MPVPEFDEPFGHDGREFSGTFTSFDAEGPAGTPGMHTRVSRLLLDDEDADALPDDALIRRVRTGESFEIKNRIRSGVGLTELDLSRLEHSPFERIF